MFSSVRVALIKRYVFFWHQQVSNMDCRKISNIMPIYSFFFFWSLLHTILNYYEIIQNSIAFQIWFSLKILQLCSIPLDNSKTWNEWFKHESCALWTIQCIRNTDVYWHQLLTSFWDELCYNLEMSKLMENMNWCKTSSVALKCLSLWKAAEAF